MNKKILWLIVGIAAVLIIGIAIIYNVQPVTSLEEGRFNQQPATTTEDGLAGLPVETPEWGNPEAPMQSPPMEEKEIPKTAIKIGMSAAGISPKTFEVKAGQTVILSVSSEDQWTHVFKFKDETLSEIAVGLSPGETRVITFIAPKKTGDYEFFCDVPGHSIRGETGKMTVK